MVKAEEVLSASADFEIKFDEDADLFNPAGYDLPQINWCDDTPPDTPCPTTANNTSPLVDGILDTLTKAHANLTAKHCDDWDYVELEKSSSHGSATSTGANSPSSSSGSASSIMWNMDTDPAFKLVATTVPSNSASAGLDISRETLTASLDLFANEDTSDDDIFREFSGMKRKAISCSTSTGADTMEAKKAKARQTRDAINAETQMRLLAASGTDSKRITHNVLERKRRNDLKASYQDLRENIPELTHQERAPTAQILSKGVEYIEFLKKNDAVMMASITAMRGEIERNKAILLAAGRTPEM